MTSLANMRLIGDYDCGVTLACDACPWDGGKGIAYIGDGPPAPDTFAARDLDGFFAFAQQHAASHEGGTDAA